MTKRIAAQLTPKNLALAGMLGLLVAESPITPDDLGPSVSAGVLAGVAFLVWRVLHPTARPERPAHSAEHAEHFAEHKAGGLFGGVPIAVWGCLTLLALVFTPTAVWMYESWTSSVWQNNHGLFIPPLMVLLASSALRHDSGAPDETSPWGFAWVGTGLAMLALDTVLGTRHLAALGLVLCLPGLSLLLLGRRRTRELRIPLLLGIFMVPIPNAIGSHLFLRNVSAAGTLPLLHGLDITAWRSYSVITLPNQIFVVSDACSGFSTLYAAIAMAVFLACFARSGWHALVLVAAALPLALIANIIRVLILILLALYGGDEYMDTALHEASGVASFVVVLGALYLLADRDKLREAFG